jgi:photosystem II stability/assembly factor-like uncharacterized protein
MTNLYATSQHGSLYHFDGSAWNTLLEQGLVYHAVWGASEDAVWAVGGSGRVVMKTAEPRFVAERSVALRTLFGVWGTGEDHVFAVGDMGEIIERQEGTWQRIPSPTMRILHDVAGFKEIHLRRKLRVFAVGDAGTILQRDGETGEWDTMESGVDVTLHAVAVAAENVVYAAGEDGTIVRLLGNEWTIVESPTNETLYSISSTEDGELFAVGGTGAFSGTALFFGPR